MTPHVCLSVGLAGSLHFHAHIRALFIYSFAPKLESHQGLHDINLGQDQLKPIMQQVIRSF